MQRGRRVEESRRRVAWYGLGDVIPAGERYTSRYGGAMMQHITKAHASPQVPSLTQSYTPACASSIGQEWLRNGIRRVAALG